MIRILIGILAFAATVCTKLITEQPFTEEPTTDEVLPEENITVDTFTAFENIDDENGINDTNYSLEGSRKTRASGGLEVSKHQYYRNFPYVVAMYNEEDTYCCVGTILTPRLILTAQHCTESPNQVYSIRAYTRNISKGGESHVIDQSFKYAEESEHDIALVTLKTRIVNAFSVQLLPPDVPVPEGDWVLALGWGQMNGVNPDNLQMVNLRIYPLSKCRKWYQGDQWICTATNHKYHTCFGDSGGPILFHGKQVGVISMGDDKDCGSGMPAANVNLKPYLDWIQSYIKNFS